jgi:hypothetical protein
MTFRFGIPARRLRISSDSPSAKYSWSFFSLISANGRTAIEPLEATTGVVADESTPSLRFLDSQNRSAAKYATAAKTTTAAMATCAAFNFGEAACRLPMNPGARLGSTLEDGGSGDSNRAIRSMKAGGVAPAGRRVHCTSWNLSGTAARRSDVSSMTTGKRKVFFSAMS